MAEAQQPRERGITRIGVKGFKSIAEGEIEIRPLTILAGANSSGKSSIMQPLLLLKQTLEASKDYGAMRLDGPNVKLTIPHEFLTQTPKYSSHQLEITIETSIITTAIYSNLGWALTIDKTVYATGDTSIQLKPSSTHEEIARQLPQELELSRQERIQISGINYEWEVLNRRCFLNFGLVAKTPNEISIEYDNFMYPLISHIRQMTHIPGLRHREEINHRWSYNPNNTFEGIFDTQYVLNILDYWQDKNDKRLNDLAKFLSAAKLTSLVKAVDVKTFTDGQIRVGRTLNSDSEDTVVVSDVGIGISQVLPVLVALLVAEPGQLVYIEQPELHLHPRAQHKLAEFIAEAANRGVRVVIETHSDLLLLGIQTQVAEGKLPPDKVILHWFARNEEGLTKITTRELDEDGAYGDWPEDFAEVDMEAQSKYLDIVDSKYLNGSN
jgi:hypothetical protein